MKGLTKFLTYVFALLLCTAAAGAVAYFVLQEKGVSFSVTQDGQRFYSGTEYEELCIPAGETYDFSVQSLVGESVDYSVKITANVEQSFDFTMDGVLYRFYGAEASLNDYTEIFGVQTDGDMFSVTIPDDFSVSSAVEQRYGGMIELQNDLQYGVCYFVLSVSVGDDTVLLPFWFDVIRLSFDTPSIVF